jgi:hypothetical protein
MNGGAFFLESATLSNVINASFIDNIAFRGGAINLLEATLVNVVNVSFISNGGVFNTT